MTREEVIAGKATLCGANLCGANLHAAALRDAHLCGANLCGADLRGADLGGADLRRANLRGANLHAANLGGADLGSADLRGANLCGANLDYSSGIPLHCGGTHLHLDDKLMAQLAAHFCSMQCNDAAAQDAQAAILEFAKTSHRANDCGIMWEALRG